jgi:hypothetical protein
MPGAIRWAAQVLSARGGMSSQVELGTVAFGVTLGVPSQGVYCSRLVTGLTNEHART